MTTETAPLAGLRVLEIASFVAAPLGGLTLAQLGRLSCSGHRRVARSGQDKR